MAYKGYPNKATWLAAKWFDDPNTEAGESLADELDRRNHHPQPHTVALTADSAHALAQWILDASGPLEFVGDWFNSEPCDWAIIAQEWEEMRLAMADPTKGEG